MICCTRVCKSGMCPRLPADESKHKSVFFISVSVRYYNDIAMITIIGLLTFKLLLFSSEMVTLRCLMAGLSYSKKKSFFIIEKGKRKSEQEDWKQLVLYSRKRRYKFICRLEPMQLFRIMYSKKLFWVKMWTASPKT